MRMPSQKIAEANLTALGIPIQKFLKLFCTVAFCVICDGVKVDVTCSL